MLAENADKDKKAAVMAALEPVAKEVVAKAKAAKDDPEFLFFTAFPSPATHAILTVLEAGESVFQTRLLTKTVVHGRMKRGTTTVSCTILASKHCLRRCFSRL